MCSRREQPHRRIGKIRPTGELGKFAPQANSAQAHPGDSASCSSGARAARTQAYPVFTSHGVRMPSYVYRTALRVSNLFRRFSRCFAPVCSAALSYSVLDIALCLVYVFQAALLVKVRSFKTATMYAVHIIIIFLPR